MLSLSSGMPGLENLKIITHGPNVTIYIAKVMNQSCTPRIPLL